MLASRVFAAIGIVVCILNSSSLFTMAEEFTFYKLAMQWPIAICNRNRNIPCGRPVVDEFTLHGLWPYWANSSIVKPPCQGEDFPAVSEVNSWDIKEGLDTYWPNLIGDNYQFWQHEWQDHGICSGMTPYDYFNLGLTLARQHRLLKTGLVNKGYGPTTQQYTLLALHNAIRELWSGVNVEIKCNKGAVGNQLSEVYFCYDRNTKNARICKDFTDQCGKFTKQMQILFPDESTLPPPSVQVPTRHDKY